MTITTQICVGIDTVKRKLEVVALEEKLLRNLEARKGGPLVYRTSAELIQQMIMIEAT